MGKILPYFKWYPSDAEGDDFYSLVLSNEELGIYHRLLNRSWLNNGISSDMDVLAGFCRMSRKQFDKAWEKVGKRWEVSANDPSKLVNPRQEQEREAAKVKSENNKREGNANAKGSRSVRDAIDPQRALARADSVCVSGSPSLKEVLPFISKPQVRAASVPMSPRFSEFWARHPGKKLREELAAGVWAHTVTTENEAGVFACLSNYLESAEVARGVVMDPEKWLSEVVASGCKATWPKARDSPDKQKPVYRRPEYFDPVKAGIVEPGATR